MGAPALLLPPRTSQNPKSNEERPGVCLCFALSRQVIFSGEQSGWLFVYGQPSSAVNHNHQVLQDTCPCVAPWPMGPMGQEHMENRHFILKKNKNQAFTVFNLFRLLMALRNCTNQQPVVKGDYKMQRRKDGPCQRGF